MRETGHQLGGEVVQAWRWGRGRGLRGAADISTPRQTCGHSAGLQRSARDWLWAWQGDASHVCHATHKTKERFVLRKRGGTHVGTTARVRICPKRAL